MSVYYQLVYVMSRSVCNHCQYSQQTCICDAIEAVKNNLKIIILQHPSEVKASKNTARLVSLALTNCEIYIGECDEDFPFLSDFPTDSTAVLYPDEDAIVLDDKVKFSDHTTGNNNEGTSENKGEVNNYPSPFSISHLIVIDGTWKKAFKIIQLTPKLNHFQKVSFKNLPTNRYVIRKALRPDSLSTLEAIAYSLKLLENQPTAPLHKLLNAFIEKQTQFMPEHVKTRYFD